MAGNTGPANAFISYAQAITWENMIAGIRDGVADLNRMISWLQVDVFAVRQWPCGVPDLDFASTIKHCSSFLVACSYLKKVAGVSCKAANGADTGNLFMVAKRVS